MKKLIIFLAFCGIARAVGTVQQTTQQVGNSSIYTVSLYWTGDAINGTVPVTLVQSQSIPIVQGYRVVNMEAVPGSPAPTNNYSITLLDTAGVDVLAGVASAVSNASAQGFVGSPNSPPIFGSLSLSITGQSVAGAKGTVFIYLAPFNQVIGLAPTAPSFTSQGANLFLASPNGASGSPGFRAIAIPGDLGLNIQGNGSKVQLSTSTTTLNDCVKFDANGNTVDAGAPCTGNAANWLTLTNSPFIDVRVYNYPAQTPGGSLSAGACNFNMSPLPSGLVTGGSVFLSGGVGTSEAIANVTVSGSNVSGTCVNNHSGAWTVSSATAGCAEATGATSVTGAKIWFPIGTFVFNAPCNFTAQHQFFGASRGTLSTNGTVIDARTVNTSFAAFQYLSTVMGFGYDIDSGIRFQDMEMECFRCILINNETIPTPPSFQGNVKNVVVYHVRLNGTYASAVDANRWSNVIPTITTMRTFGVLFSCNQCFDGAFNNNEIENGGIGIYLQNSDINVIGDSTRFFYDGVSIWMEGNTDGGGTTKIINNDMLENQRVPAIFADNLIHPIIENNYFETFCPSAQFVRSIGTTGLIFAFNRIDDPANAAQCVANGGPNTVTTTPIIHLEDFNSDLLIGNFANIGAGVFPGIEIAYTNWSAARPNFVQCVENNQFFPCPNGQFQTPTGLFYALAPGVVSGALNPYLVKANNVASDSVTGTCSSSFANVWHQSATLRQADNVTFRWVQNTSACIWTFKLQNQEFSNFLFQFTGRKIGTGAGAFTIQYTDAAGTLTTLQSSNLNFVATTEVETRDVQIQIPTTAVGPGKFTLTMDGSNAEIEQIEIIPQPGGAVPVLSGCTFSAQTGGAFAGGFTGSYTSGTAGACTVTFTFSAIARNGWMCSANDLTTPADVQNQTASSATGATISGTTANADVVNFACFPY